MGAYDLRAQAVSGGRQSLPRKRPFVAAAFHRAKVAHDNISKQFVIRAPCRGDGLQRLYSRNPMYRGSHDEFQFGEADVFRQEPCPAEPSLAYANCGAGPFKTTTVVEA